MDNEDLINNDFGPFYDGLDELKQEKQSFRDEEGADYDDTSDGTSDGTSDSTSDGTSDSTSEAGFANSDSDSDSDSDSESDSVSSESSEIAPAKGKQIRKNMR